MTETTQFINIISFRHHPVALGGRADDITGWLTASGTIWQTETQAPGRRYHENASTPPRPGRVKNPET